MSSLGIVNMHRIGSRMMSSLTLGDAVLFLARGFFLCSIVSFLWVGVSEMLRKWQCVKYELPDGEADNPHRNPHSHAQR